MARNDSQHDQEAAGLQPLLGYSDSNETSQDVHIRRRKKTSSWIMVLGVVAVLLLLVHILFVASLRKTTVTLEQWALSDLCHRKSVGEVIMKFQNPSYCSPVVGPLSITFAKKKTAFLHIQIAAFDLQSGVTTMISSVNLELLTSPEVLYSLVFTDGAKIDVHGQVPVLISCMLVPFTIHLDVSNLLRENSRPLVHISGSLQWPYVLDPRLYGADAWRSGVVNGIKTELQHVIKQVLKTIALSHIHTGNR
ncbi:unnamed protein product [Peronospora destructor]|uniref:Late embryogenesis abundant protein LEA-2 subgroup domain-containing protein n=1 Tax=Peronospora destructor TaxID=86335 RepID=A0AAV0UDZ7_9STRA|nr:unnamed protein product [Peronospora destructor]